METVRQATGIGISTLSEIENGKRDPSIAQLSTLAKVYSRPLSYFFSEENTSQSIVLWRERPRDSLAWEIEARFRGFCEQYRHLESWCNDIIKPSLPVCDAKIDAFDFRDAEQLAHDVRQDLNLGEYPAYGLSETLENVCGIKIFHDEFEPSGSAACIRSEIYGMAVLLNVKNLSPRRNFDLAHELFHLVTWDCFRIPSNHGMTTASNHEEKMAGIFAANLLIPTEPLRRAVERRLDSDNRLSHTVIPAIAQQFGVSVDAVMWRIHNVFQFGPDRIANTRTIIDAAKKIALHNRVYTENPPKYPKRYITLAIQALLTNQVTIGKFCEYTGWSRSEAMNVLLSNAENRVDEEIRVYFDSSEYNFYM